MGKPAAIAAAIVSTVFVCFPAAALPATPKQRVAITDADRDGHADRMQIVRADTCRTPHVRLGRSVLRVRTSDRGRKLDAALPSLRVTGATLRLHCAGRLAMNRRVLLRSKKGKRSAPPTATTAKPAGTATTTNTTTTPTTPTAPAATAAPTTTTTPTTPPTTTTTTTTTTPTTTTPTTPTPDPGAADVIGDITTANAGWNVLSRPIDPAQQTAIPWCKRSYYLQPWRSYLDTRPASALAGGTGINMNSQVSAADFARTARMLGRAGFRTARLEVGWHQMSYANPAALSDENGLRAKIQALKDNVLRPLILLNANDGDPAPVRVDQFTFTQAVGIGQTTIQLDSASAAKVVPGYTGFGTDRRPDILITAINGSGVATLSRPSPIVVPAGTYQGYTLRYRPFTAPRTVAGAPHPVFEQTLAGWLQYADAVAQLAKSVTGAGGFDVEVWNELSFGSNFLNIANYYAALPDDLKGSGTVTTTILDRTTQYLRDPARGLGAIGISDGFASQGPWESAAWEPAGLTTMSKHPYKEAFALGGGNRDAACQPVDALGRTEGTPTLWGTYVDSFTPSTGVLFPEYPLSAIQTETMIRDLSPITTQIGDVAHGRNVTNPADGKPLGVRVTETGLMTSTIGMTASSARALQARWAMRALVALIAKGVTSVELYGARDPEFGLVDESFFTNPNASDAAAGQSITAISRLLAAVGSATPSSIQPLTLETIADDHNHIQFAGDGTAAHPPLYNRDVVAAFPFQRGPRSYAIPAYVMTRDMRQRLSPESYRLTFGGLASGAVAVAAYDPETDSSVPVRVVARSGGVITIELQLTDSPRVISIAPQ